MNPALFSAARVGLHIIPFYWEHPLCPVFWTFFFLCGALQFLLLKRARRGHVRWSLIGGLLAAMLACEIACQIVTGWDLFLPLLLYCFFLFGLLGAALSALLSIFLKK